MEDSPVQERELPQRTAMAKDRKSIGFNDSITSKGKRWGFRCRWMKEID